MIVDAADGGAKAVAVADAAVGFHALPHSC